MFNWIKNIISGKEAAPKPEETVIEVPKAPLFDKAIIELAPEIQAYLDNNGAEETTAWLVNSFIDACNPQDVTPLFADYYEGKYSKRDIIDKFEEVIVVDSSIIMALIKLGEHYNPELLKQQYSDESKFFIYKEYILEELLEKLSQGSISEKEVRIKLWQEYFSFVKNFLDIKKKAGIEEEEPVDEVTATLIKLLLADRRE